VRVREEIAASEKEGGGKASSFPSSHEFTSTPMDGRTDVAKSSVSDGFLSKQRGLLSKLLWSESVL
jgi:hypothetical protein